MTPERLVEIEQEHAWQPWVAELLTALREAQRFPLLQHDPKTGKTSIVQCRHCDTLQQRVEALEKAIDSWWHQMLAALRGEEGKE